MGIFDPSDEKLQGLYHRFTVENDRKPIMPHENPILDREIALYCKENDCTYDEAFTLAKTGKKIF